MSRTWIAPAVADFLCNGLEDCSCSEAVRYLRSEFGVTEEKAERLVDLGLQFAKEPLATDAVQRVVAVLKEC